MPAIRPSTLAVPAVAITAAALCSALADTPSFRGLGRVPTNAPGNAPANVPANAFSRATDVSDDGLTAVGVYGGDYPTNAFRWRAATGLRSLANTPGNVLVYAEAVSGAGSVVAGEIFAGVPTNAPQAALKIEDANTQPVGPNRSISTGLSSDGLTLVGEDLSTGRGFRYTPSTGVAHLPAALTAVEGISPDAAVIVGTTAAIVGDSAAYYTLADGVVTIGQLVFAFNTTAIDASATGRFVVGTASDPASGSVRGTTAFRWSKRDGIVPLGDLQNAFGYSLAAEACSRDGHVVVGAGSSGVFGPAYAMVWHPSTGAQRLDVLLWDLGVAAVSGWKLTEATGVSADGTVIVGNGFDPVGMEQAWLAVLPPWPPVCASLDFDGDGDEGTDADIEAFFASIAGSACDLCDTIDFDGDGDEGTDADIEAFFRVIAGGPCAL